MTQIVATTKATDKEKQLARAVKRKNKLNSIKNEFEGGKIKSFDQIFAIMSETRLAEEVGISFYTFRKKVNNPGEFTIQEIIRFSELVGVEYNIISVFILEEIKSRQRG
jgi:hypothetical protein